MIYVLKLKLFKLVQVSSYLLGKFLLLLGGFMSEINSTKTTTKDLDSKKVTPLKCLMGAALSGVLGFGLYLMTSSIAQTFAAKPVTSSNPIIINMSVAVRTIVVGMTALGTGVFSFVALGLIALGIQVLIQGLRKNSVSS